MSKKIKVTPTKSFRGDTPKRVSLIDDTGRELPLFGVWLVRKNGQGYYESDTSAKTFKTIKEVKAHAEEVYKEELK